MYVRGLREALLRVSAAAAVVVGANTAFAAPVVTLSIDSIGIYDNYTIQAETLPNGDGTYGLSGIGYGNNFQCNWDLTVNPDPSITGTFHLTNLNAATTTFVVLASLPIGSFGAPTATGGYLGDVTYNDANNDGNLSWDPVNASTAIYMSLINGANYQGINVPSGPAFGTGVTVTSSRVSFGLPGLTQAGPAASGTIGIRLSFQLTGNDHVDIPVFFQLEGGAVPEPATVLLLGVGLAGLALIRKRA